MFIEDCNLIKAPDLFILPLNVPFYGLLLAFDAFIKPEMGKIETFDKNRDLRGCLLYTSDAADE